jgi:hypothetical protein
VTWPTSGGGVTHLDEELSAYLDGELDEAGYQHAYHHLSTCAHCQAQLDEINRVRTVIRTAPPVDPPFGFVERFVRDRRRRRWAPAAVVGLAAAWVLMIAIAGGSIGVEPPVRDIAVAQSELGSDGEDVESFRADDIEFAAAERDEIPNAFRGPEEVGGGDYAAGFQALNRDGWLMLYDVDDEPVVVYEQLGEYEPGALPSGGDRFEIEGDRAWRGAVDGRNAVVVQRGGMTYTIVGESDVEDLVAMAEELPEREAASPPSLGERLQEAADDFVSAFALGL